ncbi:MAG: Beta-phosphoglucomutase [Ktedonobacterales bacterium]|nr:MAG: Beta-phosphoglucomutase [Ktedonobacterales bacterium]
MNKLAIFDHDGLMVNSEDIAYAALSEIFAEHGYLFPWDYYVTSVGLPVADAVTMFLRDLPIPLSAAELRDQRDQRMTALREREMRLMPGLAELLDDLKASDVPMAVATSGSRPYITWSLRHFGLAHYFDAVTCIDDVPRGKPHPDLILKALELTATPPEHAVMLEDSPHGVEAAYRAAVRCIAVPTRGIALSGFTRASAVVASLVECRPLLTQWLAQ